MYKKRINGTSFKNEYFNKPSNLPIILEKEHRKNLNCEIYKNTYVNLI